MRALNARDMHEQWRAARKLCVHASAISRRVKRLENYIRGDRLCVALPCRPPDEGLKTKRNFALSCAVSTEEVAGREQYLKLALYSPASAPTIWRGTSALSVLADALSLGQAEDDRARACAAAKWSARGVGIERACRVCREARMASISVSTRAVAESQPYLSARVGIKRDDGAWANM